MKNPTAQLKQHQIAILAAAGISAVAWALPWVSWLLLPLTHLNTHIHELGHAIAGQLTGADVDRIVVNADGSGLTDMSGGSMWVVGPAGYIGASIVGAVIIWFSRSEKGARNTLRALAFLMIVGMVLWVRGDAIGVVIGFAWVGALLAGSQYLKGMPLLLTAQFLGLQQCLNSIQAVYTLLHISAVSDTHSDAQILERYTGIPDVAWAFGWCAFSLVLIVIGLKRAWTRPTGA